MATNTPKLWLPVTLVGACAVLLAVVALTAVVSTGWPEAEQDDAAMMKLVGTSVLVLLLTSVGFGLALWTIRRISEGIDEALRPLANPSEFHAAIPTLFASRIAPVLLANQRAFAAQTEETRRATDQLTAMEAKKTAAEGAVDAALGQMSALASQLQEAQTSEQALRIAPNAAPFNLPDLVNRLLDASAELADASPIVDTDQIVADAEAKVAAKLEQKRKQDAAMFVAFSQLFAAMKNGNFSIRAETDGVSAVHAKLAEEFNACTAVVSERLKCVIAAMSSSETPSAANAPGIFAEICAAHARSASKLGNVTERLQKCSTMIARTSAEMKLSTEQLSARQTTQVTTLEECSVAMTDLSANGKANAELADEGRALVQTLNEAAQKGKSVVADTIAEMDKIDEEARKISDITRTIDELSFQTNLLSLNAAVEAARAGDAGRGFAVVATEVRSLAGRSADASKEIAELLENSTKNVGTGVEMVKKSSRALAEIEVAAQKVSDLVERNAGSGAEQAMHIEEINVSVHDLDTAIQENAKLIAQNSAASESISKSSEELADILLFDAKPQRSKPTAMSG